MPRSSRPRIGMYEPSPGPSGPSRYVDSIVAALDPQEFDVVIFGHAAGPYRARRGVEISRVCGAIEHPNPPPGSATSFEQCEKSRPLQAWRRLLPEAVKLWSGFGRESLRLARCFRSGRVDLLHTNNAGCEEGPLAARLAGIPRVLGTFHVDATYDLQRERSGLRHRLLECVSNHCLDHAIAVSAATKRNWLTRTRVPAQRVRTIHNGIDPTRFCRRLSRTEARQALGLPGPDHLLIGGVGRLDEAKGFGYLIEALALLTGRYPRLGVVLAGKGPLQDVLLTRAARLGVGDRLHLLGYCRDVQMVYDALDVFILPSRCEAFPYALLEAMAAELPAIGTRVGGVPEAIVPGETGFVVPACNSGALAAAVQPLLDDPYLRTKLGQAGRARVIEHFTEQAMVRRTLQVYRELLALPQPSGS